MADDEEQLAALALGGILTSALMRAAPDGSDARTWLYSWERDGLQWLIRFRERRPNGRMDSQWTASFLNLNRDAILSPDGKMDFNLRAARLAQTAT